MGTVTQQLVPGCVFKEPNKQKVKKKAYDKRTFFKQRWTTYLLLVVVSGAGKNVGMHCWKHSYKMSLKLEPRKEMQKIIQGCI